MKKMILLVIFIALIAFPSVLALNISATTNTSNLVMVKELSKPISFNLSITNFGPSDKFNIYNLVGFLMTPDQPVQINSGETKVVNVTITPVATLAYNGYYTFNYFIQNSTGTKIPESVTFFVTPLQNSFSVGASEINPESSSITIYIKNKINYNFKNLDVNFKSPFFSLERQVSLSPYSQKEFNITLDKAQFKTLVAGFYTMSADINAGGKTATVQGNIKFSEKDIVNATEHDTGWIIFTKTIEKTNSGNVVANAQTIVRKNIISRLFTTFSPTPDSVYRQGVYIYYTWDDKIQPGGTIEISTTTNWLLPVFVILFIVAVVILIKQFSKTALVMDKKVSFVRTKGGEFAMKVTIGVHAKKFVERLTITDRLPPLVKLYEKFGIERPSRVDEKNKRLEWYFENLEPGESRVLNYVIYSKVGVVGRFALPTATAIFERNGKISEAESNRAFLIAEQSAVRED